MACRCLAKGSPQCRQIGFINNALVGWLVGSSYRYDDVGVECDMADVDITRPYKPIVT